MRTSPKRKTARGQGRAASQGTTDNGKRIPSRSVRQTLDEPLEILDPRPPEAGGDVICCPACGLNAPLAGRAIYSPDLRGMFFEDTVFDLCARCADEMWRRTPAGLRYRAELIVWGRRATQLMRDERMRRCFEQQATSGRQA